MRVLFLGFLLVAAACGGKTSPPPAPQDAGRPPAADGGLDAGRDAGAGDTTSTCANPTALTSGTPVTASLGGRVSGLLPRAQSCSGLFEQAVYNGPDAVYSITIPAGGLLRVRVHTTTAWDSALLLILGNDCNSSPTCLAAADRLNPTTERDEEIIYRNTALSSKDVRIVVEGLRAEADGGGLPPGEYTLTATIDTNPPAAGEQCPNPVRLDGGGVVTGDLTNTLDDLAPQPDDCPGLDPSVAAYTQPDLFYGVTVPPVTTMTASVAASGTDWDVALYAIEPAQCQSAQPVCLAAADALLAVPEPERLTYNNTGGEAKDVVIGIEGFDNAAAFQLTIAFSPFVPPADGGAADGGTPVDAGELDAGTPADAGAGDGGP